MVKENGVFVDVVHRPDQPKGESGCFSMPPWRVFRSSVSEDLPEDDEDDDEEYAWEEFGEGSYWGHGCLLQGDVGGQRAKGVDEAWAVVHVFARRLDGVSGVVDEADGVGLPVESARGSVPRRVGHVVFHPEPSLLIWEWWERWWRIRGCWSDGDGVLSGGHVGSPG
jgi:hypothetical protein